VLGTASRSISELGGRVTYAWIRLWSLDGALKRDVLACRMSSTAGHAGKDLIRERAQSGKRRDGVLSRNAA
jgi:hypothetical protein